MTKITEYKPIEWISGLKLHDCVTKREDVAAMVSSGLYWKNLHEISRMTGLSYNTIHDLKWGRFQTMRPLTIYTIYEYLDKLPKGPAKVIK